MRVIIENRDGEQYSVTVADYRKLYEEQGFRILHNEDGTKYTEAKDKDEGS